MISLTLQCFPIGFTLFAFLPYLPELVSFFSVIYLKFLDDEVLIAVLTGLMASGFLSGTKKVSSFEDDGTSGSI